MIAALSWVGARARWALALGVAAALAAPGLGAALAPIFPGLVALVYALSMARIDLPRVARAALRPARLALTVGVSLALMLLTPALAVGVAGLLGAGPDTRAAVALTLASPPIASAAAFCFLLRLDAALALELTVVASVLAPLLIPVVAALTVGAALGGDPLALGLTIGAIIAAGAAAALALRRWLGPEVIAEHAPAFDGLSALAMIAFVLPLFDGFAAAVAADPGRAVGWLALAVLLNIGAQRALSGALAGRLGAPRAGALAILWGNRSAALPLAALPEPGAFALFVALYQFPMYLTPLVMGRVLSRER